MTGFLEKGTHELGNLAKGVLVMIIEGVTVMTLALLAWSLAIVLLVIF